MKRLNRARKYRRRRRILYIVILLITAGVIALGFNFKRFQNEYDWLTLKPEQKLNVPLVNQLPDLPNGCEVTSLSMLLKYYDINVSKLELSSNIKHVSSFIDNDYRGNPHIDFVGYMSIKNAGWCVYNEPLYNVARKYTKRIRNYTDNDFVQVLKLVSKGHPVVIITTLKFDRVNDMQTWSTKQGKVHVTPSSHACVITGYNKKKGIVYVNDPYGVKNKKVSLKKIQASYNQQGKQALYIE